MESLVEYDPGQQAGWGFGLPVYASLTYTHAEFANMGRALAPNAGTFAGGRNGNEIPYIPEWKFAAGISYVAEKWRVNLDASYVSTSWGTGYNGNPRPAGSNPSAIDGKIDSLLIFDLTGHYQLTDNVRPSGWCCQKSPGRARPSSAAPPRRARQRPQTPSSPIRSRLLRRIRGRPSPWWNPINRKCELTNQAQTSSAICSPGRCSPSMRMPSTSAVLEGQVHQ